MTTGYSAAGNGAGTQSASGFHQPAVSQIPPNMARRPSIARNTDDENDADDVEGDGDGDEDEEDGEHIDGSEAQHNMINESTVKSGYLEKKGEKRKTWKKRWFVLRSSKLAYYKNDKEYQLLRFIDIGDIKTVASVELKRSVNTFGIVTPKRTFYVRASSRAEMESWIEALNEIKTQYAQSSTMTQEMAAIQLASTEAPPPSATIQGHHQQRSGSQERAAAVGARPITIGIPGQGTFVSPAQPRPIPGSNAFSPLTITSESENGAERFGLSYTSSTGQSLSGSPGRIDPSYSFMLAGQSPGAGGHNSGSEMSDYGGHQRRPSAGFGSLPRQRSTSATRRLAGAAGYDPPASPGVPQGSGQVLSSSDEEDDWDEEEVADQAMPLPALGTSQQSQQQGFQQQHGGFQQPSVTSPGVGPSNDLIRDPNKVITQGYLMKQSGRRKVWRKRWFVLTPSRLVYSRSHMDAKAHRQIPISSMLDALEYEPKKPSAAAPTSPGIGSPNMNPFGLEGEREGGSGFSSNINSSVPEKPERRGSMVAAAAGVASNMSAGIGGSKKRKENCFQIITPKRTFILCAPGEDEEIKWISAIKTLINRQRNGQTPGLNPPLSPTSQGPATAFPFGNVSSSANASNVTAAGGGGASKASGTTSSPTSSTLNAGAGSQSNASQSSGGHPTHLPSISAAAQTLSPSLNSASLNTSSTGTVPSGLPASTSTTTMSPQTPRERQRTHSSNSQNQPTPTQTQYPISS